MTRRSIAQEPVHHKPPSTTREHRTKTSNQLLLNKARQTDRGRRPRKRRCVMSLLVCVPANRFAFAHGLSLSSVCWCEGVVSSDVHKHLEAACGGQTS